MMTSQLAEIPLANQGQSYDGELRPTAALRGLKKPASRRSVLRGVAASALTVGALSLTWGNSGRAFAEENPSDPTRTGWDKNDCKDAYPDGYEQQQDTGGEFETAPAACFGGSLMSSEFCDENGWYRSGEETLDDGTVRQYQPVSDQCGLDEVGFKNSWKWTTPDGKVYRCSDGNMTVIGPDGAPGESMMTICRALVPA